MIKIELLSGLEYFKTSNIVLFSVAMIKSTVPIMGIGAFFLFPNRKKHTTLPPL